MYLLYLLSYLFIGAIVFIILFIYWYNSNEYMSFLFIVNNNSLLVVFYIWKWKFEDGAVFVILDPVKGCF